MSQDFTDEQIYDAIRAADAAGDGEAVRTLAQHLRARKTGERVERPESVTDTIPISPAMKAAQEAVPTGDPLAETQAFFDPSGNRVGADYTGPVYGTSGSLIGIVRQRAEPQPQSGFNIGPGINETLDNFAAMGPGVGDIVEGALGLPGMFVDLLEGSVDWALGRPQREGFASRTRSGLGLPDNPDKLGSSMTQFTAGALSGSALAKGASALLGPSVTKNALSTFGSTPLRDGAAGAAAGAGVVAGEEVGGTPGAIVGGLAGAVGGYGGSGYLARLAKSGPRPATSPLQPDAALDVINEGAKRDVPVMTSDVLPPKGFTGKIIQATGERIPYAGTGGPRVAQNEARIRAVRSFAEEFGAAGDQDFLVDVADDLIKTRGDAVMKLKTAKDSVIDPIQGTVPLPNLTKAIDGEIFKMFERNTPASREVAKQLQAIKAEIQTPRTLRQIEDYRADEIGKVFDNPDTPTAIKTVGEKALRALYDPLRKDMGNHIMSNGGRAEFSKWKGANDRLSKMMDEFSSGAFKRVMNEAERSPEDVAKILFSKKPSDVKRLYRNLSASGKAKARSAVVARAMEKAADGDLLSPAKFRSEIERLSAPIGVVFDKNDQASIDGLSRLLQATQRASTAAAAPPTGVQTSQLAGAGVMGGLFGPVDGAVYTAMAGLSARLYESAPVRNLLVSLSKTKPGSQAERSVLERITRASAPTVSRWKLERSANDNTSGQLAAEDEPELNN